MYFQIVNSKEDIRDKIVANDEKHAIVVGDELYPGMPLTITKITHAQFHANNN